MITFKNKTVVTVFRDVINLNIDFHQFVKDQQLWGSILLKTKIRQKMESLN